MSERKDNERPLAYPQPTQTDQQLKNQPEYIDQQPNDLHDRSISDVPSSGQADVRESNSPKNEEDATR